MTQEFVTLPREVVEQAMKAMSLCRPHMYDHASNTQDCAFDLLCDAVNALSTALDQPQNHVPDAGNMVPAGRKLVLVEPNCSMVLAGERSLEQHDFLRLYSAYRAMLDAAPKPPTVKDSLTVEQPQAEQPAMTPIAQRKLDSLLAEGYTISGYSIYHERKHQHGFVTGAGLVGWWKPEGMEYLQPLGEQEPVAWIENLGGGISYSAHHEAARKLPEGVIFDLYTHQQPRREPLTDERIWELYSDWHGEPDGCYGFARAIESAHNIK